MSKSGLYAHFGSKEELQLATIDAAEAIFDEVVVGPMHDAEPGIPAVLALADSFLDHLRRRVFPGGCFFACASAELQTRPGPAQGAHRRVRSALEGAVHRAVHVSPRPRATSPKDEDLDQLWFEIDAYLLYAHAAFAFRDDPAVLDRASDAVRRRLGRHPMTDEHEHHDHDHDARPRAPRARPELPDAVAQFRADKDDYFKHAPQSPIPTAEREAFTGLPYYPVDESMAFEDLALQPYTGDEPSHFQIPTSDGKLRPAHRAGVFAFEVGGAPQSLTAYVMNDGDPTSLFVPFLDATSGTETYGAGRYLDLEPEDDGTYVLDFNLAYHPSCVYDTKYSCPLTPAENRLPVRVEAGERLPEGHGS